MKQLSKTILKRAIISSVSHANKTTIGRFVLQQVINNSVERVCKINHDGLSLSFCVPNPMSKIRVDTFSTKEPETLEWIDSFTPRAVFWDIGANIGLYSCYAAKRRNCRVFAFEPSVFNLEMLARNAWLNNLAKQITIIPLPLTDELKIGMYNMSNTLWGGAISTFGESYSHNGLIMEKVFEFSTLGLSMNQVVSLLKIQQPDYIKIDVDGIEHLILKGGVEVLENVKGILVEINEEFEKQAHDSFRYLSEAGLFLKEKRHSEMFKDSICFNQIWAREKMEVN